MFHFIQSSRAFHPSHLERANTAAYACAVSAPALSTRRSFLRRFVRGVFWTSVAGGSSAYAYGRMIERHRPQVERVSFAMRGLGPAFEGFRIAQISDLHLEPNLDPPLLVKTVAMINALKPDLIALTGDFVTHNARRVAELSAPLAGLRARCGVVASLGNHDVWSSSVAVTTALKNHGLRVLLNEGFDLTQQGETLWIAGLDSAWAGNADLPLALKGRPRSAPCVLLGHEPDFADEIAQRTSNVLQLAGHTHGGQVCIPGGVPVMLPAYGKKYPRGSYRVGPNSLYVNRGLGTIGPKARFACPPEITEITLRSQD